jgi:hypothetical protein
MRTTPNQGVQQYDFPGMTPSQRDELDARLGLEQRAILARSGVHAGWSSERYADAYRFSSSHPAIMLTLTGMRARWGDGPTA